MDKRFRLIKLDGNYDPMMRIVSEKVTLNKNDITLIFDFFVFWWKKTLIQNKKFDVVRFGKFDIKAFKTCIKVRFLTLNHSNRNVSKAIPNAVKFHFVKEQIKYDKLFNLFSKSVHINFNKMFYLLNLFIYSIIEGLRDKGLVKIKFLGYFYTEEFKTRSLSKNHWGQPVNPEQYKVTHIIRFKMSHQLRKEVNNKVDSFYVTPRLKKILDYLGVSTKISA